MPKKLYAIVKGSDMVQQDDHTFTLKKPIKTVKVSETHAMELANNLAAAEPGCLVHVLESICVCEAVVPKINKKSWNENGEFGLNEEV